MIILTLSLVETVNLGKEVTVMKMKKFFSMMAIAFMLVVPVAVGAQFGVEDADFDTLGGSGDADLKETITTVMQWLFGFLGLLAVFIILWGGFKWMTAGGDEDKVGEAKNILKAGVIGLIIILSSYMIASFVFNEVNDQLLGGA